MEFNPSFEEIISNISSIFPENPFNKYEIPAMVAVQPSSTLSHPPSHENAFLYRSNYHTCKQHPLNGDMNYSSFSMEGPSSINPFGMIPTSSIGNSFKATHTSGPVTDFLRSSDSVDFSPNNNKIEATHDYLNNGNSYLGFVNKNPLQYNVSSQSQVGLSLSPILVNDAFASVRVRPMFKDDLSHIGGIGNHLLGTDLRLDVGDEKTQRRSGTKNNDDHHSDTNGIKGQWTVDQDRVLIDLVGKYGEKEWSKIAKFVNGRNGKQCRGRWNNHLRPNIRKDPWSEEEEKMLIETHKQVGNKWEQIAKILHGRTENTIKNHWNAIKRRVSGKRKQNRRKDGSKATLLENYIKEVTNAIGDET